MVDTHFSNDYSIYCVYINITLTKKENIFIYCFCSALSVVIINIIVLL